MCSNSLTLSSTFVGIDKSKIVSALSEMKFVLFIVGLSELVATIKISDSEIAVFSLACSNSVIIYLSAICLVFVSVLLITAKLVEGKCL